MRNIKKMTNRAGKRIYYKVAAIITAAALFCVQGQTGGAAGTRHVSRSTDGDAFSGAADRAPYTQASEIEAQESVLVPAMSDGTEEKDRDFLYRRGRADHFYAGRFWGIQCEFVWFIIVSFSGFAIVGGRAGRGCFTCG